MYTLKECVCIFLLWGGMLYKCQLRPLHLMCYLRPVFLYCFLCTASPAAEGSSQARGQTRAAAAAYATATSTQIPTTSAAYTIAHEMPGP